MVTIPANMIKYKLLTATILLDLVVAEITHIPSEKRSDLSDEFFMVEMTKFRHWKQKGAKIKSKLRCLDSGQLILIKY